MTTLLPGQSRSGEGAATTATDANGLAVFDLPHLSHSILGHPLIRLGPDIAVDLPSVLGREWLVTNGPGGYASGTLAGINTRRLRLAPKTGLSAELLVLQKFFGPPDRRATVVHPEFAVDVPRVGPQGAQ